MNRGTRVSLSSGVRAARPHSPGRTRRDGRPLAAAVSALPFPRRALANPNPHSRAADSVREPRSSRSTRARVRVTAVQSAIPLAAEDELGGGNCYNSETERRERASERARAHVKRAVGIAHPKRAPSPADTTRSATASAHPYAERAPDSAACWNRNAPPARSASRSAAPGKKETSLCLRRQGWPRRGHAVVLSLSLSGSQQDLEQAGRWQLTGTLVHISPAYHHLLLGKT
ncbi:hypothetical protein AGIG_G24606 [Arapaima gigas]